MKKYLFLLSIVLLRLPSVAQQSVKFDDIKYHFNDPEKCRKVISIWELGFKSRLLHNLNHTDTQTSRMILNPNEPSVQVKQIKNVLLSDPSALSYGFHWVAIATKNLKKTVADLTRQGCTVGNSNLILPTEREANAVLMTTEDGHSIVLVQREEGNNQFNIDHVQLMVRNLEANISFFQKILGASLLRKKDRSATLQIGNQKIILSEPEALGWMREEVTIPQDANLGISLGFLCEDLEPIYYAAKGNHFPTLSEPKNELGNDIAYITCVVLSPDNVPIELKEEDERTWKYKTVKQTMRVK